MESSEPSINVASSYVGTLVLNATVWKQALAQALVGLKTVISGGDEMSGKFKKESSSLQLNSFEHNFQELSFHYIVDASLT